MAYIMVRQETNKYLHNIGDYVQNSQRINSRLEIVLKGGRGQKRKNIKKNLISNYEINEFDLVVGFGWISCSRKVLF